MASPSSSDLKFSAGFVVHKKLVYIATDAEVSADDGSPAGLLLKLVNQQWGHVIIPVVGPIAFDIISGPNPDRPADITVIGVEGEFIRSGAARQLEQGVVDDSADGPRGRGWIRAMRRIGDELIAVGMSRQAYARGAAGKWRRIDRGLLAPLGKVAGLNGVDGFSSKDVYAAGLNGEIWRYDGASWHELTSPTNVSLHAVRRCGEWIYIVGGSGVVLRGRGDHFNVAATEDDLANLYAVEPFGNDIYVASLRKLYRFRDGILDEVATGLGDLTTGSLHAADGVLWSIGAKHLVNTEDKMIWAQAFI
jgi:hypothetical protein